MDIRELNIDGLIDTGALSSVNPKAELRKIRLLVLHTKLNEDPPLEFQHKVDNGQLEPTVARVELQVKKGDKTFREKNIVMKKLYKPFDWSFTPTTQ